MIRQLVGIIRAPREMLREEGAGATDAEDEALGELSAFEVCTHGGGERVPEVLAAFLMDALIADHGESMGTGSDKNEDAVAVGCSHHFETLELLRRRGNGVGDGSVSYTHLTLPTNREV